MSIKLSILTSGSSGDSLLMKPFVPLHNFLSEQFIQQLLIISCKNGAVRMPRSLK